jgi:predicted ribosomally synthesized peptide with SipW-like signal peptide
MDKKILASMLIIGVVSILLGAGTVAYFSDTETSKGNTFTAGTLDLKVRDFADGEDWTDGVTKTWTMTGMIPGVSTVFGQIELRNDGTIPADHLEITCSYTVIDTPDVESDTDWSTDPDDFAKYVQIIKMEYSDDLWYFDCLTGKKYTRATVTAPWVEVAQDEDWKVSDIDGVDGVSLYDLNQDPLDNLTPPNGVTQFDLKLKFSEDAGNDLQGDTLTVTIIFTLNQDSTQ